MSFQNNIQTDNLNSFLDKAVSALSCDSNCQKEKTSDDLKQKYLAAKTNLVTAPINIDTTFKNYMVYLEGEPAYNEYKENELKDKATKISADIQGILNQQITDEIRNNTTYDGLLINVNNIYEYYEGYLKENIELNNKLKITESDIVTNDRKTYYEDQGIESLKKYYNVLFVFYIIIIVAYIVCCFIIPSQLSIKMKIIIFVLLGIYPFISAWLFKQIIHYYHKTTELLPKNVYTNI
jgi:hypothetical protein